MSEFWNERYTLKEYVYGTKPNVYFETQIAKLSPGKILFPAEGEGRNAVYAARLGWDVYAFDSSIEARKKAYLLAKDHAVGIKYELNDIETAEYPSDFFDCIVLIFAHFHPFERNYFHSRLLSFLKPGGNIILEGFSKKQLQFNSGGPRTVEMLFSEEEIQNDFKLLSKLELVEAEIILDEGKFHQGSASVIRMVGEK